MGRQDIQLEAIELGQHTLGELEGMQCLDSTVVEDLDMIAPGDKMGCMLEDHMMLEDHTKPD
jgi:hypothetical protein